MATVAFPQRGVRAFLPIVGPAFIASVAYMDPGNFATNIQAGASYGYQLLWVVVIANLMAMLFQALSAKLGIVTGKNLAELCRERTTRSASIAMWIVSEIGAMATDLAEFLGATIGLSLLFHLPMLAGALLTGTLTYAMLMLQRYGFRPLETLITALVGVIVFAYAIETVLSKPHWNDVAYHSLVPWLGGSSSVFLAVGIVGATVMPHAIYLHSALTQQRIVPRDRADAARVVRFSNIEVAIALTLAGLVNLAMMYMAGAVFHAHGKNGVADIATAYRTLEPLLGNLAASAFLISLIASGISSSVVGTLAGQVIMQGFVGFSIPLWVRRVVTMLPAIAIIALGFDITQTLILSQVVLSFVLPIPVIALIVFTARRDIMGGLVNSGAVTAAAIVAGAVILALNTLLLLITFHVPLPFMGAG